MTDPHYSTSSDDEEYFEDASPTNDDIITATIKAKPSTISEQIEQITAQQQNLSITDETKDVFTDCRDINDDENDDEDKTAIVDKVIDDDESQRDYEKSLTPEQLLANKERADTLKLDGNHKFKEECYAEAIEIYTEAIQLCPLTYDAERSVLYGNRGATHIQLNAKSAAIDDCTKALQLNKDYMKVLIRRAKLYEETDKFDESLADYKQILELNSGYGEAHAAILRLTEKINERNEKLKTEMLGKLKDLGNMILKPFGLSTNNFQMQQDPSTGSYSVNFKQ